MQVDRGSWPTRKDGLKVVAGSAYMYVCVYICLSIVLLGLRKHPTCRSACPHGSWPQQWEDRSCSHPHGWLSSIAKGLWPDGLEHVYTAARLLAWVRVTRAAAAAVPPAMSGCPVEGHGHGRCCYSRWQLQPELQRTSPFGGSWTHRHHQDARAWMLEVESGRPANAR